VVEYVKQRSGNTDSLIVRKNLCQALRYRL